MKLLIYGMLKRAKRHTSFHTPGHKIGKWDITELSFSDNLACPTGVLREAEAELSRMTGAARSFFLTDGSTCGVLSMLRASGVKRLFVPRESHKSVYNGCKLSGIEPVIWRGEGKRGLPPVPTPEAIERCAGIDGVLVTSPDYYGQIPDLKGIRAVCDRRGLVLLIDGAHGAHLRGEANYAGNYADYWVDGVHKSLPALTQGAVVSAKREGERLKEAVDLFRTSSPSYPILASIEYALKAKPNPKVRTAALRLRAAYGIRNDDWTKLVVPFGSASAAAEAWLERRGVYPEFDDGTYLMFYLSDRNRLRELKRLSRLLARLRRCPAEPSAHTAGARVGAPVWMEPAAAIGKTCARDCGLFPPCIPLLSDGDVVTAEDARKLLAARNTFGTKEGKICVYQG